MTVIAAQEIDIELSPTLGEMVAQGKCTLFVGPLISTAPYDCLGPPNPTWLAFEMAERLQIEPERYDLTWVSQLYADKDGRNALRTWVAARLANTRYCATLSHYLVAQLPFPRIVYTAQDSLMRMAHESRRIPASVILPGGNRSYATQRMILQLYGSAEQPATLKLTEDERRRVWDDKTGLGDDLRSWARSDTLLFLGYTANDPELSDFYYLLRSQDPMDMPRAYIVGSEVSADYVKYWEQHNVTLYPLDTVTFLQKLAKQLNIPMDLSCEEPPALDEEERGRRDRLRGRFEYLSHLNAYVETSAELRRRFEPHVLAQMRVDPGSEVISDEAGIGAPTIAQRAELESLNKLRDGNIEWSQGNLDLARVYFEEALRQNPDLTDAYLSLFHLLVERGDLEEALQVYKEMLTRTPQQAFLPERYQIQQILGQDELGVIYCAFDREEDRLVTATILRRAYAVKEEDLAQFAARMRALSSLRISRFLGFDRHRGRTYMLSEYAGGQSLRRILSQGQPLPYAQAMQIAGQIAEALGDGHRSGIPHLSLQPSNILVGGEGVKLVSYGFSRLSSPARSPGKFVDGGSYEYLSPEQLAGQQGDERSDIYALGTILYQMLTGHPPGVGSFQHPSEVNLEVTEAVDVLIDHARERYPDQRFTSIHEIRIEIGRIALASFGRWFGQYVRAGLARISQAYKWLASRKTLRFFLLALVVLMILSTLPATPTLLRSTARLLVPLLLDSLLVSNLFDWSVRAIARRKGLGSLITSGRGMGAVLGLVFALNLISVAGFKEFFQLESYILNAFAAMLAIVLFESVLAVIIILGGAWAGERLLNSYTIGFYWSFMALVAIEIILIPLGQPYGIFKL